MFDDPVLNIVLSVYYNPGVYALLLGSGISRSAQIPTGWEITLDLINKIAVLKGESTKNNPELWYIEKYREDPDYSELLEELAKTQIERRSLLNSYFEPTEDEREKGIKIPTIAHRAIASLIKLGYIKVILTTNFDRLMEQVLEEMGIIPDIISNEDSLKGAIPIEHSKCTIVKLHGDYKDTRIKNTSGELEKYSTKMNKLLDEIFDKYGLIICGWSGQWDVALRNAILRCSSRRFTTYWTIKGDVNDDAKDMIKHKQAINVTIENADTFFTDVESKIKSLRQIELVHPADIKMIIELTKRYLSEEKNRIQLHDFVNSEIENSVAELSLDKYDVQAMQIDKYFFQSRLMLYENAINKLMNIFITIAYFDRSQQYSELFKIGVERIASTMRRSGSELLLCLQYYPALLLVYASCIIALYKQHFNIVAEMVDSEYYIFEKKHKLLEVLNVPYVSNKVQKEYIPLKDAKDKILPFNDYILETLLRVSKQFMPDLRKYADFFDIFEFLLGMIYMDRIDENWGPIGRFYLNWRDRGRFEPISTAIIEDYIYKNTIRGDDSPIFKAGLFNKSQQRLNEILVKYVNFIKSVRLSNF